MVNMHYRILHNLLRLPNPSKVECMVSDYLDEYPEDVELVHDVILRAYTVVKRRMEHGTSV